jgi:hypothetical protein
MTSATDGEIQVMMKVSDELAKLEPDAVARVLRWVADRHAVSGLFESGRDGVAIENISAAKTSSSAGAFKDIAEFFYAVNPTTDAERALIVGYWLQEFQNELSLDAQKVNSELKQLGHGVTNITTALSNLIDRKPRLVIQISKSGKARQSRKKYRLTAEGIRRVHEMIEASSSSN